MGPGRARWRWHRAWHSSGRYRNPWPIPCVPACSVPSRGTLPSLGGAALAVKSDAFLIRTALDPVAGRGSGNLAAAEAGGAACGQRWWVRVLPASGD